MVPSADRYIYRVQWETSPSTVPGRGLSLVSGSSSISTPDTALDMARITYGRRIQYFDCEMDLCKNNVDLMI